jgi:hypothetical protein
MEDWEKDRERQHLLQAEVASKSASDASLENHALASAFSHKQELITTKIENFALRWNQTKAAERPSKRLVFTQVSPDLLRLSTISKYEFIGSYGDKRSEFLELDIKFETKDLSVVSTVHSTVRQAILQLYLNRDEPVFHQNRLEVAEGLVVGKILEPLLDIIDPITKN